MAQKRAGEVEAFLSRPDPAFPVILLYGPDPGLVSERAAKVAELSGVAAGDPFASVSLAADELEKDIGRLHDEARTISMFGGRRLIRVRGAGAGKALCEAVAELAADPPPEVTIVLEAGELRKSAALRVTVERGRAAMALPCFPDEARALDAVIDAELEAGGLVIDREAREALRARLGADRIASRGEVRKLCLYCYGAARVTVDDVRAIVGDVSADTLEETVDAAVTGEVRKLPHLVDRLASGGASFFQLQQSLLRYLQQLQAMRVTVERAGEPVARVVERRRPHFSRRAAMETALSAWTLEALAAVLRRIEADILRSRKESALAFSITRHTLLAVAVEAARLRAPGKRG